MFRKMIALFTAVLLMLGLTGCMIIPVKKNFEPRFDVSEITSVEIFNLGDDFYDTYELDELMKQNFIPVAVLESERYSGFVDEVKELEFSDTLIIVVASVSIDYSFTGYIAKITYASGEYEILNHKCQVYHNDKGNYADSYRCDEGEWDRLIEAYLDTD